MAKDISVVVKEINIQRFVVTIKGKSNLIFHKWDEKSIQMIVDKQMRKSESNKRTAKNPEEQGEATFYKNKQGKLCIPAIAVKTSMVSACRNVQGLTMALIKGCVFVRGDEDDLLPIEYEEKSIRRDTVRIGMGMTDVRFRGQVKNWKAKIPIEFNGDVISADQVINLLNIAGFSCGLLEWRPEKGGNYGSFEVIAE